jgi:ribosome-binding ATPase YchF (GTP1/OBG family)
MARFMRAIHTVRGLWMARTSRAMTDKEGKDYIVADGDVMHFRFNN